MEILTQNCLCASVSGKETENMIVARMCCPLETVCCLQSQSRLFLEVGSGFDLTLVLLVVQIFLVAVLDEWT